MRDVSEIGGVLGEPDDGGLTKVDVRKLTDLLREMFLTSKDPNTATALGVACSVFEALDSKKALVVHTGVCSEGCCLNVVVTLKPFLGKQGFEGFSVAKDRRLLE